MTAPQPRIFGQNHESYRTSLDHGIVQYTAPCATCKRLAEYVARPGADTTVWFPTCEAQT